MLHLSIFLVSEENVRMSVKWILANVIDIEWQKTPFIILYKIKLIEDNINNASIIIYMILI